MRIRPRAPSIHRRPPSRTLESPFGHCRASGLIGLDEFDTGAAILGGLGLLDRNGETFIVPPEVRGIAEMPEGSAFRLLLDLFLGRRPPDWLRAASAKEPLNSSVIPDRDLATVESVIPDRELREAILLEAGYRFDANRLATLGVIGEQYVVELCRAELVAAGRPDLSAQVVRVSTLADNLGYDVIAPTLVGTTRRLEVKASRGGDIYISRNEFFTGCEDPDWALVAVGIDAQDRPELWGWLRASALVDLVPMDRDDQGRWQSARLLRIRDCLQPGLPSI